MNLSINTRLAEGYKSKAQIARVLTEDWVLTNSYCPSCGEKPLNEFENNRPVADFYCQKCNEEFELKSKSGKLGRTVADGTYTTMLERIKADNNPNFFFLTYTQDWLVNNFLIIPKQFFTPATLIKRKPLAPTAKRAGWVGCNLDLSKITAAGKVFLVKNTKVINKNQVTETFNKTLFLRTKTSASKGWVLDVLACLDTIKNDLFTLDEMYKFEAQLQHKYPNNRFIKEKIRQQLQLLRDMNLIEFISPGRYKKLTS